MPQKNIMVIGDVMLDKFSYGRVKRLNPESPAQLINIEREEYKLGGAANVAANITSLGENTILIGRIGNDTNGNIFQELCQRYEIHFEAIISPDSPTTTKARVIETTYHQQLIRMDYETIVDIQDSVIAQILSVISSSSPDLIIISDYKKGFVSEVFAKRLIETGIPVIADVKPGRLPWFRGALLLKPNFKEFREQIGVEGENTDSFIEKHGAKLAADLETNLVITRSEHGASIVEKGGNIQHIPTEAQDVFDVTGAGDTFMAAMGISIVEGKTIAEAAQFGNRASAVVVGKVGTATVMREELRR